MPRKHRRSSGFVQLGARLRINNCAPLSRQGHNRGSLGEVREVRDFVNGALRVQVATVALGTVRTRRRRQVREVDVILLAISKEIAAQQFWLGIGYVCERNLLLGVVQVGKRLGGVPE